MCVFVSMWLGVFVSGCGYVGGKEKEREKQTAADASCAGGASNDAYLRVC